jgi:hypothetical protein
MSCGSSYDRYDFNEYFEKFLIPHPQLQYFTDEKKLLEFQEYLSEQYIRELLSKEEVKDIYKKYTIFKRKTDIELYEFNEEMKKKIRDFKKDINNKNDNFIIGLMSEL